jgi:glutamyl-tRNA synthetase
MSTDRPIRVRFAPSPTGYLHIGGARTALFNWLFAKNHGGTFVLRIEDTDAARNTPEALAAIVDGLRWLGLDWDEGPEIGGAHGPYFQSQRKAIYDRYLQQLLDSGHAYEDGGAIRLRSPKEKITVDDRVCGQISIDRSQENDTALRRSDGSYIFHFVNVVDDIEMKISHVIRGEDHLMNTPKHLEIFHALGAEPPIYAHIPLILNMDGSKMSKRDQGAAVMSYMDEGFVPEAVVNFLCLLGWSAKDDRQKLPLSEVIPLFDWDHLNRSPAKFDYDKCLWLNSQYLADKSPEEFIAVASSWLHQNPRVSVPAELIGPLLTLLKPKIKHLPELQDHLAMLCDDASPIAPDAAAKVKAKPETVSHLAQLIERYAALTAWDEKNLQSTLEATAADLGIKPGALLFPLRVATTGQGHGADLIPALALLGSERLVPRLRQRVTALS